MSVLRLWALPERALERLCAAYGMEVRWAAEGTGIPGTHWGEPEAGLIGNNLYVRADTPVHSALHEACHWICMPVERRENLHTDAGGDDDEENGVNYLAILLADRLPGFDANRMLADMDEWGYSFRLGSARAWFEHDAEDARAWLAARDLLPAAP